MRRELDAGEGVLPRPCGPAPLDHFQPVVFSGRHRDHHLDAPELDDPLLHRVGLSKSGLRQGMDVVGMKGIVGVVLRNFRRPYLSMMA